VQILKNLNSAKNRPMQAFYTLFHTRFNDVFQYSTYDVPWCCAQYCIGLHVKCPLNLLAETEITRQIALNSPILNFMKIRSAVLQPALGPNRGREKGSFPRTKRPQLKAGISPPPSTEIRMSGANISISPMPSHRAQGQSYFTIIAIIIIVTVIVIITTFHKAPHNLAWTILDFR
jgi:hypothetical protein